MAMEMPSRTLNYQEATTIFYSSGMEARVCLNVKTVHVLLRGVVVRRVISLKIIMFH